MEEEKNVDLTKDVQNVEPNAEEVEQTDNMAEDADNRPLGKNIFSKKNSKDKVRIQDLEAELDKVKTDKAELNDRFLRLYSEFENYKKRVNKEKLDLISTASEKVILGLLPIVDDFERAIKANERVEDIAAIKDGFVLIYNKLIQMMKRFDVEEIPAQGEVFNTDLHEAVTQFPTDKEEDKDKVIDVTEKGYKIKDKVIRYAKVVVAK